MVSGTVRQHGKNYAVKSACPISLILSYLLSLYIILSFRKFTYDILLRSHMNKGVVHI